MIRSATCISICTLSLCRLIRFGLAHPHVISALIIATYSDYFCCPYSAWNFFCKFFRPLCRVSHLKPQRPDYNIFILNVAHPSYPASSAILTDTSVKTLSDQYQLSRCNTPPPPNPLDAKFQPNFQMHVLCTLLSSIRSPVCPSIRRLAT